MACTNKVSTSKVCTSKVFSPPNPIILQDALGLPTGMFH